MLATMIGLAVGIDYALFIVTRHRQNLADGLSVEEAAARANATAGGAVVFAGMTVVIAIGGLAVVGIPFLTVMGLAAAATVFIAVGVAVTLLPALLGFAGHNIDKFTPPRHEGEDLERRRRGRCGDQVGPQGHPAPGHLPGRRPGASCSLLAVPMLSLRLGFARRRHQPTGTTQRQAYDLLAEGFGPGFNGPLTVVVDLAAAADRDGCHRSSPRRDRRPIPDIAGVGPASLNEAGDTAVISATPTHRPGRGSHRGSRPPTSGTTCSAGVESQTGAAVSLTGATASNIDICDKMLSALPVFMILVIGLTLVLLLVVFRSILVPIKAAIAILLSIASSFGVAGRRLPMGLAQGPDRPRRPRCRSSASCR